MSPRFLTSLDCAEVQLWYEPDCHSSSLPALPYPTIPLRFADNAIIVRPKAYSLYTQNVVPVFVNRLYTLKTFTPYEYDRFDVCQNDKKEKDPEMNLGQVVFGERIKPSPYKLKFKEDVSCQKVCEKKYIPGNNASIEKLNFMKKSIMLNFQQNWIIDNMPVTWCYLIEGGNYFCLCSFPLGCYVTKDGRRMNACIMDGRYIDHDTYYFFNHVDLTIKYHPYQHGENADLTNASAGRIVAAWIKPRSVAYDENAEGAMMCRHGNVMGIRGGELKEETTVRYTYSVKWEAVDIKWASRWDYILDSGPQNQILWFSMTNSLVVVSFLTGSLLKVMWTVLSKSATTKSNKTSCFCKKKTANEFNWKLIYGDIFRPPSCGMLLAILNGSGVQLFMTSVLTLVFASMGILSPANRGALETAALVFFACLGFPAGYTSANLYKVFGGEKKLLNALLTAVVCPGIVFVIVLIIDVAFMAEGSSAAIPVTTILALFGLWLGISLPLTLLGSFFGFRKKSFQHPVQADPTPRHIPKLKFYLKPVFGMIIGGILPFGALFIQEYFILNSIWTHQYYYKFGFLALVFLLMVLCCSLVTILMCYFHLCAEDYRWWWRAFLNSGSTSIYVFIYCMIYYVQKTNLQGSVTALIYVGCMLIVAFLIFLITGTIGFFSCFLFVRKIYGSVKGHDITKCLK